MPAFWEERPATWTPTSEEYYASDLVGSTALADFRTSRKLYFERHVEHTMGEQEATEPMMLGSLVDLLLTEKPEELAAQYFVSKASRRGTKDWKNDEEAHPTKTVIKASLMEQAKTVARSVRENSLGSKLLLGPGPTQVCHRWMEGSVECRMRLDKALNVRQGPAFADLKAWNVIDPIEVSKAVYNRGTHRQMSLYQRGFHDLYGVWPLIFLLIVHNWPPFEVAVYQLSPEFLTIGGSEVTELLADLNGCVESGDFGNPWEKDVFELTPPAWAMRRMK